MRFACAVFVLLVLSACGNDGSSLALRPPTASQTDATSAADGEVEHAEAPSALASQDEMLDEIDDVEPEQSTESAEPDPSTPSELTDAQRETLEHEEWKAELEASAGPSILSCSYVDPSQTGAATVDPAPGAVLESAVPSCPDLVVPELPCTGSWGVLPGLPDVLVVLDARADVFGEALRVPGPTTPRAIVCLTTPANTTVVDFLVPCGDARIPGQEHLLTTAQRMLRSTTTWHADAAAPPTIGADAIFLGGCVPPGQTTGDPSVELMDITRLEDAADAGDRVVDYVGTWDQLLPLVERIDEIGTVLQTPHSFSNDTCLALDVFIQSFDHAVSNAAVTHGFPISWLNDRGEFSGSDYQFPARLGTSESSAKDLLNESRDLGEEITDMLGDDGAEAWMAESLQSLVDATGGEGWLQLIVARFNAEDSAEIYADLDEASRNSTMLRHLELLGLVDQVRDSAECTGRPEPRTDWINPEVVFVPVLEEYDTMGSSPLREYSLEPTTSTCDANIVVSDLSEAINMAAGWDVFGFDGAGRLNASAVSLSEGSGVELAAATLEAARSCPPEDRFLHEVRDVGGYPVIVSKDREDSAEIWVTHFGRNNVTLRFAKWFTAEDPEEKTQRFLLEVEKFRAALDTAVPEPEIFLADLR